MNQAEPESESSKQTLVMEEWGSSRVSRGLWEPRGGTDPAWAVREGFLGERTF